MQMPDFALHLFGLNRILTNNYSRYMNSNVLPRTDFSLLRPRKRLTALFLLLAGISLAVVTLLLPGGALVGQVPQQTLTLHGQDKNEGNSGITAYTVTATLDHASATPVTGNFSAVAASLATHPATGGTTCGGNVDFVLQNHVPFTIPANATSVTFIVFVCGDTTIEYNEVFSMFVQDLVGAQCNTCSALGFIRDDDSGAALSINSIAVSEPVFTLTQNALFTVSLNHPTPLTVTVNYRTNGNTATENTDFLPTSGTLVFPPNTLSQSINVAVLRDGIREPDETFYVQLLDHDGAGVLEYNGFCTIHDFSLPPISGSFSLSPDNAQAQIGVPLTYTVVWTVPDGQVWRDLNTIDLRFENGAHTPFSVRWNQSDNTFSVCEQGAKGFGSNKVNGSGPGVHCSPPVPLASGEILETGLASIDLFHSNVTGSGPTGRDVTLNLEVTFKQPAAEKTYDVRLAASNDLGNQDSPVQASRVTVIP